MSINIPTWFVQQYSTNLELLLQQKVSRLNNTVRRGSHVGKQASPVDQVGAIVAQKVNSQFAPMGRVDAPLDRRWVFPVDYNLPQLIDHFDKLRLLADPNSSFAMNAAAAMNRAQDDEIIAAYFATAKTGEQGGTSTTWATTVTSSGGQNVSVNVGGTTTNLNVAKLREAKKTLMAAEVDLDTDMIFCPITASQHDALLNEIQVISSDFNGGERPVLQDGKVTRFLGMNFPHTERITTGTDDQSGTSRQVPCYAQSGMYLGEWEAIQSHVDQRVDLTGRPYQLVTNGTFGATRLEERKMVRIWCRES